MAKLPYAVLPEDLGVVVSQRERRAAAPVHRSFGALAAFARDPVLEAVVVPFDRVAVLPVRGPERPQNRRRARAIAPRRLSH